MIRTGVLFVCMGNICRSPTAEAAFRRLVEDAGEADTFDIDSAGTHAYHVGETADPRAVRAAERRGLDLSRSVGRQATRDDFRRFDYILAMDRQNCRDLMRLGGPRADGRLRLFLDYAPELGLQDVPDPYFGGPRGFERVLDIVAAGATGLLESIRRSRIA